MIRLRALAFAAAIALQPATATATHTASEPVGLLAPTTIQRGAQAAKVALRLDVSLEPLGHPHGKDSVPGPRPRHTVAVAWQPAGDGWVASVGDADYQATLRLAPDGDQGIGLDVDIRYRQAVRVNHEVVSMRLPGEGSAVGRDLAFAPVKEPLRVDRGTPALVDVERRGAGGVVVAGGQGVVAARYLPAPDYVDVQLILDDPDAHPFSVFSRCRAIYLPHMPGLPKSGRPPASLEHRTREDHLAHAAGEVTHAHATLYLSDPARAFTPLIVERWPAGARAALVFTDHADRTDPAALRAVLYGTSDRTVAGYGHGGLFGHGLKLTKTFFASPGVGSLDDDPDARELADAIVAQGSEVGAHSITPRRDLRGRVVGALSHFAPWHPVTWIDHQPETNCEAISNRGWSSDPEFGLRDLLVGAGYRWVWSARDVPQKTISLANVFQPGQPDAPAPAVFPLPQDGRLWLFTSSWFYDAPARLTAAITPEAIARLEREHGLFVGHTYLSASSKTTISHALRRRDLVVEEPGGALVIDPAFDAALGLLGDEVKAGRLASLTWSEAGERLRALGDVALSYRADGGVSVENRGGGVLRGLTVAIPGRTAIEVEGAPVLGTASDGDRALAWFDLPAGGKAVVRAAAPLLAGGPLTVQP